ncbi:hypothetical protein NDU88_004381 [Pleurodeles waltl]|uniref:Uncharacterized protein n=1 Tax=Pleurodeles waltl TaxID=8319 RepID=A0AAV7TSE8_PLEWA|nr:hypothetical protein NDU88_004381 [Pleurodeles waltl]
MKSEQSEESRACFPTERSRQKLVVDVGVDLPVALQVSVDFQPQSRWRSDSSAADRSCVDLFPARQSVCGFLTLGLPASPFRIPGTGWAPLGRVGVSAEAPGASREKSLLSLRLQTTGGKL